MLDPAETQTRRHLWLTLLAVLALVAAVALTLVAGRGQNSGAATNQLISGTLKVSTLESAHLACPSDPTFSPDGSRLVIFGVLTTSLSPGSSCSALDTGITTAAYAYAVFDTRSGQPIRVMSLDSQLLEQLGDFANEDPPQFAYSSLGWSPDGTHVAFAFTAFTGAARSPESVLDSGLLLLNASSGRMTIVRGDSGFFSAASGVSTGFPVWHVAHGSELPSFLPSPALSYRWSQDGVPQPLLALSGPLAQLPAEAGPHYPVGAPDGGSRFTIWQPGLVIGAASLGGSAQSAFVTAFPAWSPDGADVTLMVAGLTLAGSTSQSTHTFTGAPQSPPLPLPATLPAVPARDAALGAVQAQVGDAGWDVVAWNDDGTLLASTNCFVRANRQVEIRDTATGALLAHEPFTLPQGDSGCATGQQANTMGGYPGIALSLQWSPQGDRLLLVDCGAGTLTFYQIHQLSRGSGDPLGPS